MTQIEQDGDFDRKDWHLNVTQLAAWLGVSRDTMHSRGLLAKPDAEIGRERLFDVRRVLRENMAAEFGVDAEGEIIDVEQEKRMKLRAERQWQEIKNATALGELAPIDLAMTSVNDALAMTCSWLQSVPSRIKRTAPELAGVTLDLIEKELAKLQNSICDCRIKYTDPRMAHLSDDGAIDATSWRAEIDKRQKADRTA